MENKENSSLKNGKQLEESHGTGVLSTMIFMIIAIVIMIGLKNFIG